METSGKIFDLYIVASNRQYGENLKQLLDFKLKSNVVIQVFSEGTACIRELQNGKRPNVIVLDYYTDQKPQDGWDEQSVLSRIRKVSPDTAIITISNPEDTERALKTLAYGAFDYVSKDEFAPTHIVDAVKKCLYPSKV
jgi:DNA-binding NarL/FixJ family response regulator